jgi:hypothetical protein
VEGFLPIPTRLRNVISICHPSYHTAGPESRDHTPVNTATDPTHPAESICRERPACSADDVGGVDEGVRHAYSALEGGGMTRDGAVRCACTYVMHVSTLELHGCHATVHGASRRARIMEGPRVMRSGPRGSVHPDREVVS